MRNYMEDDEYYAGSIIQCPPSIGNTTYLSGNVGRASNIVSSLAKVIRMILRNRKCYIFYGRGHWIIWLRAGSRVAGRLVFLACWVSSGEKPQKILGVQKLATSRNYSTFRNHMPNLRKLSPRTHRKITERRRLYSGFGSISRCRFPGVRKFRWDFRDWCILR